MSQRSVWYQVGALLRSLLGLDSSQGAKSQSSQPRPRLNGAKQPQRSQQSERTSAGSRTRSQVPSRDDTYGASPGQFGVDATRDATDAELRQVRFEYAPNMDRDPDPGEIVWTWVPYVENDGRGKDRPVLIIGRIDATSVVGCYVSTKQHRDFISIGTGDWDSQGRESFLSPERILRITHDGMRREGALVGKEVFAAAVREILAFRGVTR